MVEVVELNDDNFDEFVSKGKVVVDFWAAWCGPCQMMKPIFHEAAEEAGKGLKFGSVNVDENSEIAQRFQVMSIPTLIFFKDKTPEDKSVGVIDKDAILEKLEGL